MPTKSISAVTGTNQTLLTPTSGKCLVIDRIVFTVDAADTVSISEGNAADTTRLFFGKFTAAGGAAIDSMFLGTPVRALAKDAVLAATAAAANLHGVIEYHEIDG